MIRTDMHQSTQIIIMSIIYVIFLCSIALEKNLNAILMKY